MRRLLVAAGAASGLWLSALVPHTASAQNWNDERSRALVERATARRAQQLADTGLKDYKAVAHGYVTFLAQVGEGLAEPPKIVKADELVNEVYWLAPNLSKQRILGRRDTLMLPTDIAYHRDHLGIVQNNFPAIIRLGDGDEVVDVPHPLSTVGLTQYDFAITDDSLNIQLPGRTIHVMEVKVRPKNDRQPRIIGALYIDRDDAQVVRMAFNFTRAAFRDDALEDLFVVIENSLFGGRFWLPHTQEIEIRRGGTWLDYPIRGIIRGRWDIGNYEVNIGLLPSFFGGPEIVRAPRIVSDTFHFTGQVLDSLPSDVRAVTDADIEHVRTEARTLVRAEALRRPQQLTLFAQGASDFVRFDRAEGFAVGAGLTSRFGGGYGAAVRARYGIDDRDVKGNLGVDWQSPSWGIRGFALRDFRDAGDIQERSGIVNSLAAQEFGGDVADPYHVQGGGVGFDAHAIAGFRTHLDFSVERQHALLVRATPASGAFGPLVPAASLRAARVTLSGERPTSLSFLGTEVRINGSVSFVDRRLDDPTIPKTMFGRAFATMNVERPFDVGRVVFNLAGGLVGGAASAQDLLYFGGPVSSPGYGYHELVANDGATARIEWRMAIPAPSISLGRFGRVPGVVTLAPFLQGTFINRLNAVDAARPEGVYPAAGMAIQPFFDLLRLQGARGLRNGRWTFNVDVTRDFWGVL